MGTDTLETTGSTRVEGMSGDMAISTDEALPRAGSVSLNDHTGCVPSGAEMVSLILDPAR